MGALLVGSLLGGVLSLAWKTRAGWVWAALAGFTLNAAGAGAPWYVTAGGGLATALAVRWAFRALRDRTGAGGVAGRNGERGASAPGAEQAKRLAKTAALEGVAMGPEPPPRMWPVTALVPQGPRPRWRLRWHPVPVERVARGYVTTVIGSGGTGKSYLLVDLALALLTGTAWLRRPVAAMRSVLYVDAELDADTMRERAYQVARGRGLPRPPGYAHWWQRPASWLRPRGLYYLAMPVSLNTEAGLVLVAKQARTCKAGLVLFDSLTIGSAGAALSDQNAWNDILTGMESWGVPVVCIDHMGKSERGGAVGSFMKQAKVRSALELERQKDGSVAVEHAKSNFGPMLPGWTVRPVFEHADPEDPMSAVVRFDVVDDDGRAVAAPAPAAATRKPRWRPREQAVLDAFRERGAAGATAKAVGEALRGALGARAERTVYDAVKKLEGAGALVLLDRVPTPGGGPPAARYAAAGELPLDAVALAQAEALLRSVVPAPSTGGAGGAGGAG